MNDLHIEREIYGQGWRGREAKGFTVRSTYPNKYIDVNNCSERPARTSRRAKTEKCCDQVTFA
jgi:hypothetical protein